MFVGMKWYHPNLELTTDCLESNIGTKYRKGILGVHFIVALKSTYSKLYFTKFSAAMSQLKTFMIVFMLRVINIFKQRS